MSAFTDVIYNNLIANDYWRYLLDGLATTLIVTFFALILGLVLGFLVALIRTAYKDLPHGHGIGDIIFWVVHKIANLYVTFIRGTPTMIQLLIMFNVILVSVDNLVLVASLTFGLNSAAYVSEIFRAGIQSVPRGQVEAARSLGMSYFETFVRVVMPQAFKNSFPALGNEVITLFKETSISGTIGMIDLSRGATIIISKTFSAAVPYFSAALIYLALVILLERIFHAIEMRNSHAE